MTARDITVGLVGATPIFALIFIGLLVERLKPAQPRPLKVVLFNLAYSLVYVMAQALIVPVLSAVTVLAVNAAGGGWIVLPTSGWMLLPAFMLYTLTLDLFEYLFHRAQHRVPALWAMHSLHHSDPAMNASTTDRHYWAEYGIKMLTIYLIAGLLFKANPVILGMYALLSFYNVFPHTNLRVGFGRWSVLMNSPQYHRLHHSSLPVHHNCNFVALFPIFDLIFGTYRMPCQGEYPPTGLESGDQPSGLIEAICWPVRIPLRRLFRVKSYAGQAANEK